VPDEALDRPVLVLAREYPGVVTGLGVRRAVGVALEIDGGHGDGRGAGQPLLQVVIARLAFGHAEPPPVIVDHDRNVIRVVECGRGPRERGVVEGPLR
jgi:hypothetical protein